MQLQKLTTKFGGILAKNSPTILTGIGVAGLVATAVMAVKATPKAIEILERESDDRVAYAYDNGIEITNADISPMDMIKLTWKCYVPAAVTGLLTIGAIIMANNINLRRNAALASVYALSEAAMKEYQSKVVETLGKNKQRQIKDEIAKDRIIQNPVKEDEIIFTGKGETLCYDSLSGRYFKSDIEQIRQVLNKLSRDLMTEMYMDLNHVYSELGLKSTKLGDNIGWHIDDGLIEPDFSSQLTENGTPCLVLDFVTEPRYGYNNY
jgi:hypothetical protein